MQMLAGWLPLLVLVLDLEDLLPIWRSSIVEQRNLSVMIILGTNMVHFDLVVLELSVDDNRRIDEGGRGSTRARAEQRSFS